MFIIAIGFLTHCNGSHTEFIVNHHASSATDVRPFLLAFRGVLRRALGEELELLSQLRRCCKPEQGCSRSALLLAASPASGTMESLGFTE
jgi:hypothetical protein